LQNVSDINGPRFDRVNALVAIFVLVFTFIVYRLTVAPTLSFWDCGEFIASAYILGVPHPPGFPLYVLIGRIFSVLPIAGDICLRINLLSVASSAVTAMFGYLLLVRIIHKWYGSEEITGWKRIIAYIGGVTGAMFMAFSLTNWGNAVEAEVYGLSMMIMTIIFWLSLIYLDNRETPKGSRLVYLICYLAMVGVGVHLTTFLIMPVAAIFLVIKKGAPKSAWIAICSFFIIELLAIIAVSDGRGGFAAFVFLSLIFLGVTAVFAYRYIDWPILIGIGAFSMIMIGFYQFAAAVIGGIILLAILSAAAGRQFDWKKGIIIILVAVMGFSVHLFIPIRSAQNPNIDENNASRDFHTFVNLLDRKQYGSELMVERMFNRRGTYGNQFGRHAHMGYWSYFEEQYGMTEIFGILFLLGLFGVWMASKRKVEVGMPFLIFLLLASAGLVLYMNFADGIKYNPMTGDAYQEVRNRDYFFTPAFVYFGLALGLGVAAVMEWVRVKTATGQWQSYRNPALGILSLLVFLPAVTIASNYYYCDRSENYLPYIYSYNILNSCEENAILFTSGDNDTFPLWCVQDVYGMRRDVRVVNLSLLNTDWYIYQMKTRHDVPISLTGEQILWYPFELEGHEIMRPKEPFPDRPRRRMTYLIPLPHEGRTVKLQDMMVDEIVIENKWQAPVYFSSEPYAESPLGLRDRAFSLGVLYRLDKTSPERRIDADEGYRLYKEVYKYDGLNDPTMYRDENATGVFLSLGFNAIRVATEFNRTGQTDKAKDLLNLIIDKYPEFFQSYEALANIYRSEGDTSRADSLYVKMERVLTDLVERNPENQFYLQDLGLAKHFLGKEEEALEYLWRAFDLNPNSSYAYRKLVQYLYDVKRMSDIARATQRFADYKVNRNDPLVQQLLGGIREMPTETAPPPIGP